MCLPYSVRLYAALMLAIFGFWAATTPNAKAEQPGAVLAQGEFVGKSKHVTTGRVAIVKNESGYVVVLGDDFSLDGAPAPTLGFGKSGKFDKKTDWVKLKSNTGKQVYALPASIDPTKYDEFYVWCRDFSVPLGVAKLSTG